MTDLRTKERRISDYYSNCLKQLERIDTTSIHSFWEVLRYKAEVKTFAFTPTSRKLFRFFMLLALDTGVKVPVSVKRFLDPEEKKMFSIGASSLLIKDEEEAQKELISLFISQEVKDEMRKIIDNVWDNHIDVDEEEQQQFEVLYKDLCLFGHDYRCLLN